MGDAVSRFPGEDDVDRVLGEDGDEGQHGDRQPRGDVELRHLGRPRQHEGGADDGGAEEHGRGHVGDVRVGQPQHQSWSRDEGGGGEHQALSPGMDTGVEVLIDRRHWALILRAGRWAQQLLVNNHC